MTKCVVFLTQGATRLYINENDSLGTSESNRLRLFGLDSRCVEFPSIASAKQFVDQILVSGEYTQFDFIGYHGITENGNACTPFVKHEMFNPQTPRYFNWLTAGIHREMFPQLFKLVVTDTKREGLFSTNEMFTSLEYLRVNMVEEEIDEMERVLKTYASMSDITDIECHDTHATVYFIVGDTAYSITIAPFNLGYISE